MFPIVFHHGLFTTLRRSTLAHDGEALASRRAFEALPTREQDSLIEFLKTLQVLPPGTKDRIVDETFRPREWPPTRVASGLRNLELLANGPNRPVLDLAMARDAGDLARRRVQPDAVGRTLALQRAAVTAKMPCQFREFHASVISKRSRTACGERPFCATSRWYCSTSLSASARFDFASSSVSPCEMAAGISSTKQIYPPSSAGSNTAVNFMALGYHDRRSGPLSVSNPSSWLPKTFVKEQPQ